MGGGKRMLLAGVAAIPAAACTPVDTGFGETFRWDMAQQIVDPDPVYEGTPMEGGSGERSVAAMERYLEGEVTPPVQLTTTSGAGSTGPK